MRIVGDGARGHDVYLLDLLSKPVPAGEGVEVEYRLACSGEFYRELVETGDWRKSDATRLLLTDGVFHLSVVSRPFNTYPQELCVRFRARQVTESSNKPFAYSSTFLPDAEIVDDLCAVLTLLSRRLVSVVTKTKEVHDDDFATKAYGGELPMPTLDSPPPRMWTPRPGTIKTTFEKVEFVSHEPPPVAVNDEALAAFLSKLPALPEAEEVVHAARLYSSALEIIETRPDTAYLALVSVIETLSSVALANYKPNDEERISLHKRIRDKAMSVGVSEVVANELALMASDDNHWIGRRFKKFCVDHCGAEELSGPDLVFLLPMHLSPPFEEFGKTVSGIYSARSKHLHGGLPFPRGMGLGISPWIKARDLGAAMGDMDIPPAAWFERVVSIAARKYLLGAAAAPFN